MMKEYQDPSTREVRDVGRNLKDKSVFEINQATGTMDWLNDYALSKLGYTMDQITSMSIFDLSPERFHERIREDIAESRERGRTREKERRFSILPLRAAAGNVSWWYVYQNRNNYPKRWLWAEHIQDTGTAGPEFVFMCLQMETVNSQADLEIKTEDIESWVEEQIRRVDGDVYKIKEELETMSQKTDHAVSAAKSAAQHSLDAKNASLAVQTEFRNQFQKLEESQAQHTGEILKLIGMDTFQDKRILAFEEHVKATTEVAVKTIEEQANVAGKGLSRKVTIPIGVLVAAATAIQLVIQNWQRILEIIASLS